MTKPKTLLACAFLTAAMPTLAPAGHIVQHNLVSDLPGVADSVDANLVNSWGITRGPHTPWWVADNGTGVSTLYNGAGVKLGLTVTIPPASGAPAGATSAPTGTVFNPTSDFMVGGMPTLFLFVTEDGTIAAWGPSFSPITMAVTARDNSRSGAIYKGMTLGVQGGANRLYAANFHAGTVEVYDGSFTPVTLSANAFMDPKVPSGFAPFNVQNIGGRIFVSFAEQKQPDRHDEQDGPGLGYVTVFDTSGNLIMRLQHGKWMNAPWGMTQAPSNFAQWSNRILVGQFGSGEIATFDDEGEFQGLLRGPKGKPISINGLWGLGFGNDGLAGPSNTLFFAAGLNDEADGLFGTLVPSKPGNEGDDDNDE